MNPYLDLLETPAAPDAQKPKNPYLDLLDADEASAGAQRQASLRTAVQTNPDEAAKARGLSKTTGLPEDLVLRNLRDVEMQAVVAEADKRLKTAPISAERMRQVPFARIAHDDVENLVSLESRVRDLGGAVVTGVVAEGAGKTFSGGQRLNDMAARGLENIFVALGGDRESIPTIPSWLDPGKVFFGNPGRMLKALGGRFKPDNPNFATDVASGLGQFAFQAAAAVLAPQASLPALFAQGADAMGEKIDGDKSSQAAKDLAVLSGATLTGLTDKFALDVILGPLAVPIKNQIAASLARIGIASATEGVQETVENIGQDALRKLLTNEKADIEWLDNLYGGGVGATVGGIARGLIESALHVRRRGSVRDQQAARAEQGAAVLGELNDLAAASKVRARDTESFRAFIDDVAEDGPVPDIYISANALAQSGVTIEDIAAVSQSAAEQVAAAATGADIRIPTGEFASTVAGTDLAAKLLPHLKTEPGGMSQAEAQEYLKTHGEELQAEVERALAEKETTDALKASRDAVQANILGQLKQANRFTEDVNQPYSLLMAARYGVLANQLGITPEEAFNRFPVRIASLENPAEFTDQGEFEKADRGQLIAAGHDGAVLRNAKGELLGFVVFNQDKASSAAKKRGARQNAEGVLAQGQSLDGVRAAWTQASIKHAIMESGDTIELGQIVVPERGQGAGTRAMQQLIDYADAHGKRIVLTPSADFGGTKSRLVKFYKRFGFVENKGRNKDFTTQAGMIRAPQTPANGAPNVLNKGDQRGAFDPPSSTILMLKGADLSTFVHESGHFFLEAQAYLALDPNAPQAVRDDMNTLLDWFGVQEEPGATALEVWHRMTLDEQREHHEKFARGFEAFLFEGKSPNVEMRGIFQRFRAWLMNVYASIKNLNVKLTDEVRGVMDRMLATEQEIKEAEAANAMGLLFKTPEEAAAFGVEWEAYQEIAAQPTEEAITELAARGVKDMQWLTNAKGRKLRELQRAAAEKRREVRREVQREVLSQPVYRAWQFLAGKDSAEIPQPETEAETEFKKELADWEQRRAEREAEATKEARDVAWEASDEAKATFASNKERGFAKGRFLSKDRKRIDLDVQRLMLDWEAANAKPVKPAKPEPETRGEAVTGKIRTEILRGMYGNGKDAVWRKLSARRMTSDTQGSHPDMVAEAFGFASGDEMVQALAEAQPPREAIEAATDQRMLERFGDISSPEALERAVNEAIHNDARQRMAATELAALEKANDARTPAGTDSRGRQRTVATLPRAAKQFAQNLVAGLKVRDIKPAQYQAAAARAAKAAEKALKAGDVAEAAKQKRNQLVNGYAVKAAQQALAEADRARAYLRRAVASKATDREYLDQIEKLLERVELRPISDKAADKRKSLAEWIKAQEALGHEPVIDDALREDAEKKAFRDMTVEEVRGLVDTVRNIEHLGRLKKKLLTAKDKRDFDAIADAAEASIIANGGKARPVQLEPAKGVIPWLQGFWASHRKFSSLMRQMDGGQDGIMGDLLVTTANTAGTNEEVMIERATMALADLYAPVLKLKGGLGDKRFIGAIGNSLTRAGRLSIALNWGNPQNRQRVMDGDGWTEAQVNAILSTLSPTELQFVNGVWEYLDTFWPEVAAKELRVSGVAPEKVEPAPFAVTASDGTTVQMRGGYYPLKYDADRSVKAESQEAAEVAKDMMRGAFTRATTRRGHTKARVENVGRPVRKDLNVITQHVTQVVHDLAWHEWIIDANRLLGDKRVAEAILAHYGPDALRTLKDDLMGTATADVVPQTKIDRALMLLRANVSRSVMGMSMTTALLQPFGLTQSMVRIGPKHVLRGVARWGGDAVRLENSMTWIGEKSDFMRLRAKTFNRELREISQTVEGKSKTMQVVDGSLFWLMRKMQMVADVPTWIGQYEKSLADGKDEADAVAAADRAVLESQGGGQIKDMAEVQRKHPMLTQFYSYFSVTLNLAAESTAKTDFRNPRAVAGWLGDMALLAVIPALAPSLIVHALRGGDDDEWPKHLLEWQVSYLFGLAVGVREFSGLASGFDYAGPPVGRVVVDTGKTVQQIGQGEVDEPAVLAVVRLLGSAFGIPTAQAIRSYRGWKAWDEGDAPPTAILFGPPPKD